ncbi:MAG: hypothetical protein HOQ24_09005, partial [Mycobacteriaceae bacterium]|nr:hypothetical protein [Mycobacteriaceae bacterium]
KPDEDDKEHQTADYLRGDHLEQWLENVNGRGVLPPGGVIGDFDEDDERR